MNEQDLSNTVTRAVIRKAFNVLAERHDKGVTREGVSRSLYHAATWSAIVRAVGQKKMCSVLDIGGGNGLWTMRLAQLGHNVVYVDIAEEMARIARDNLSKSGVKAYVIVGDAHNLDFLPSNYFDVVLAVGDLLCYSESPDLICRQAYKRCKPGGKMIVAVMGRLGVMQHLTDYLTVEQVKEYISHGWWVEFDHNELENNIKVPLFARTYTVDELRRLCLSTGWKVKGFFGAGILRTLIGRENLSRLIDRVGIESVLSLEKELAKVPSFLECAMEFGVIIEKPRPEDIIISRRPSPSQGQ